MGYFGKVNLHVHEERFAIIEIALGQPNTNWQDRITLYAVASGPKSWN